MYWEIKVPEDEGGTLSASITVEADDWFSALRNGLKHQKLDKQSISNISCDIKQDGSIHVTDFVTRKVYMLTSYNDAPVPLTNPKKAQPEDSHEDLNLDSNLVDYKVFFKKDEASDNGSGIYYRERLVAVAEKTDKDSAAQLASAIFEKLKLTDFNYDTKLFISVQIFDHPFVERSKKPAIAALTWKEWNPRKTKIQFPLTGDVGITLSRMSTKIDPDLITSKLETTPVISETASVISETASVISETASVISNRQSFAASSKPKTSKKPKQAATKPTKDVKKSDRSAKSQKEVVVEDAIIDAFEQMQQIYSVHTHDKVATFALELCRDFVKCEAGSTMLITPGKYELYVAASQGEASKSIIGKTLSLTKGVVGFAARAGAVITVSDPKNDPRFDIELDNSLGFITRNIVCAPIQYEGKIMGVIELLNSHNSDGFLQNEANVLSYIAGAVGEYIENSLPSREAEFNEKEFTEFLSDNKRPTPTQNTLIKNKKEIAAKQSKQKNSNPEKTQSSPVKNSVSSLKSKKKKRKKNIK